MKKTFVLVAGSFAVAFASLLASLAGAQDGKPSIKQVMNKLHKGAKSPLAQLKNQVNASEPNWAQIEKTAHQFVVLGAALEKNVPPKGDAESWKNLAGMYFADSQALEAAAKDKNIAEVRAAQKRLAASCKACHTAHKGKAR